MICRTDAQPIFYLKYPPPPFDFWFLKNKYLLNSFTDASVVIDQLNLMVNLASMLSLTTNRGRIVHAWTIGLQQDFLAVCHWLSTWASRFIDPYPIWLLLFPLIWCRLFSRQKRPIAVAVLYFEFRSRESSRRTRPQRHWPVTGVPVLYRIVTRVGSIDSGYHESSVSRTSRPRHGLV